MKRDDPAARLVGFIMRRELDGSAFHLINPIDVTTPEDARLGHRRMKGHSPQLGHMATVFCEARPYGRRDKGDR